MLLGNKRVQLGQTILFVFKMSILTAARLTCTHVYLFQLSVANLLFVDNPVGTGFSYVDSDKAYTTNLQEIVEDLLAFYKAFIKANEDMAVSWQG